MICGGVHGWPGAPGYIHGLPPYPQQPLKKFERNEMKATVGRWSDGERLLLEMDLVDARLLRAIVPRVVINTHEEERVLRLLESALNVVPKDIWRGERPDLQHLASVDGMGRIVRACDGGRVYPTKPVNGIVRFCEDCRMSVETQS
jgi:hypothetical protein